MRAAIMRNSKLVVDEFELPTPAQGEALVKTLACGICGSDLHALKHADLFARTSKELGGPFQMDVQKDVVMGHEFCAEVMDYGPGSERKLAPGTRVCSVPALRRDRQSHSVGYSNLFPGGYAQQMLLSEALLLPVPNGLSTELAALTEPMAVGYHAVQKSEIDGEEIPLVIGCGPVGLAVIVALKGRGIGPVIASDFSAARRDLAVKMGADIVVDPAADSPYESWQQVAGKTADGEDLPPNPLHGRAFRTGVIYECVGVPGVIDQVLTGATRGCRIVVVGVCMETDHIRPLAAIIKELSLQFVLGYSGAEFARTLHNIAEGEIDVGPLITGKVGIEGVADAFEALADPEQHAKILVEPWRD